MRVVELKNSKTEIGNKIDALKQILLHIEEVKKDGVKFKFKELKKNKNIPKANPFDFTEFVEKRREDNEIDLGLFLELAEKKQDYIQSSTSKLPVKI